MGMICMLAGAACLVYYLVIFLYAGSQVSLSWIWPALAVFFFVCGLIFVRSGRAGKDEPHPFRIMACALLAVLALMVGVYGSRIVRSMRMDQSDGLDAILILGAQVKGKVPSRSLKKRLERGLALATEMPEARLILSGGRGPGEEISEAQCMKNYLLTNGVEEERMVLEENSTSTRENLSFSDALTGCGSMRTGLVTNDFHVARVVLLAEKEGYTQPVGIPSSADPVLEVHFILREILALAALQFFG